MPSALQSGARPSKSCRPDSTAKNGFATKDSSMNRSTKPFHCSAAAGAAGAAGAGAGGGALLQPAAPVRSATEIHNANGNERFIGPRNQESRVWDCASIDSSIDALYAHRMQRAVVLEFDPELDGAATHLAIFDVFALAGGQVNARFEAFTAIGTLNGH